VPYDAEQEHRLNTAAAADSVVHNRMLIVVHCHGRSAVIYLLN